MAKLVFIHGRGQRKKNHEELRLQWIAALKSGLNACNRSLPIGTDIVLPFYGIELDQLRKEPFLDPFLAKGEEQVGVPSLYQELLTEFAENANIMPSEIQQEMDTELVERGLRNTALAHAFAKILDNKYTGDLSISLLTRDVFDYLTKPYITNSINKIVLSEISDASCLVVGHSLGSIIGYNVLAQHSEELDIQAYITIGSPLGLRAMGTHIYSPLTMPDCIRERWYNAYDQRDIVALKPLTKEYFDIDPEVFNYGLVNNEYSKHHGIEGYLGDPAVAMEIYEQLIRLG